MSNIAIIAALDREIAPLVSEWKSASFAHEGHSFHAFEDAERVAIAGGIGCRAAQAAARAIVRQYKPQLLISAGLAGALISSLKVASIFTPNVIVDSATGKEYRCETGGGVLVTAGEIAAIESKPKLVEKFHGLAVDMEAAAVAQVAQQAGISFRCVKAISDEAALVMPPMNRFVDGEGRFQNGRFVAWVMVRPQWWPATFALMRNSGRAADALCKWLQQDALNNSGSGEVAELGHSSPMLDSKIKL